MSNVVKFRRIEAAPTFQPTNFRATLKWLQYYARQNQFATLLVSAGLVVVVGLLYWWRLFALSHITCDNAYVESEIIPINSRMMGMVHDVLVEENQTVQPGQPLLKLDPTDILLEQTVKKAKLAKAEVDYGRAHQLFRTGALSQADLDLAEANRALSKADLEGTQLKLSFTSVLAPTGGTIAKRSVHPGQFVQPGQSLLVMVGASDQSWIRANLKETQIRAIKPGQAVKVHIDAYPSQVWDGKVIGVFPSSGSVLSLIPPENATGNFTRIVQRIPIKVSVVHKPAFPLLPGMSATVTVIAP